MTDKDDNKKVLNALTAEGKEITINIKIVDSEKAQSLMGTMYDYDIETFGVKVTSWGFWDTQEAQRRRVQAMFDEIERHKKSMETLRYKSDQEYLDE